MTLLVAASPCALALGTPAAILAGVAQAARNGVLVKGGRPSGKSGPFEGDRVRQDRHDHAWSTRSDRCRAAG